VALGGATVFFQGLTVWHRVLDVDEANYGAIAALMNAGGALYGDGGVDNKPPGVFWFYSLSYRAFGLYDMRAVHVLKVLVVLATAAIVAAIARRLAGRHAGWIAALLYIVFTAAGYQKMAAANTEVLMMLPACASVLLLLQRRWVAAGAVLALAVLTKQVAVFQLALFPLAAATVVRGWRPVVGGAAGFAAGLVVMLALLGVTGSIEGFWRWTVVAVLTSYGPSAWTQGQLAAAIQGGLLPWLEAVPLLLIPALARLPAIRTNPEEKVIAGWLVTTGLGALAGGHFFGHYFIQLVGPAGVLGACALASWRMGIRRPALAAVVTGLLAAPAVYFTADDYSRQPDVQPSPASLYVAAHVPAGGRVFVWGDSPGVYLFSGTVPATRFVGFLRGFPRGSGLPPRNWDTQPIVWQQLGEDFGRHPALLVVDTSTANWLFFGDYPMTRFPVLPGIVERSYEQATVADGVTIYRLR
jgi:4-amino-4-deoxy-L-arabinose transferase-like glycosyltransferase